MENVLSDDDSFLKELENTPTKPLHLCNQTQQDRYCTTILRPRQLEYIDNIEKMAFKLPCLSPNEELKLLAVKIKPNAPDADDADSQAPSPPRSSSRYYDKDLSPVHSEETKAQITRNTSQRPKGATLMDFKSGEMLIHQVMYPTEQTLKHARQSPSLSQGENQNEFASDSESSMDDRETYRRQQYYGSSPETTSTPTPSALVKRIQQTDGELVVYMSSHLPRREDHQPYVSCDISNDGNDDDHSTPFEEAESNSYLQDLGLDHLRSTASDEEEMLPDLPGDDLTSGSSSYIDNTRQLGNLLGVWKAESREYETGPDAIEDDIMIPATSSSKKEIKAALPSNAPKEARKALPTSPRKQRSSMKLCFALLAGVLTIAAVVGFALYLVTRRVDQTEISSLLPNDNCMDALRIDNAIGATIHGKLLPNIEGAEHPDCLVEGGDGHELWYHLDGIGARLSASTCSGTEAPDTQVLLFEGDSCGTLRCIAGSDELCGAHGSVGWLAEEGMRYFIVVKGFRSFNSGDFTLTISMLSDNSDCSRAILIEPGDAQDSILDSTRDIPDYSALPCEETQSESPAAWYRIQGDGSTMCASISTDRSQQILFGASLSVLKGFSCSALACEGMALLSTDVGDSWYTSSIAFVTDENIVYYLVAKGIEHGNDGDFVINLSAAPTNGVCERADPLVVGSDIPSNGTLQNACSAGSSGCNGFNQDMPSVWYKVNGTGEIMTTEVSGLACHVDDAGVDAQSQIVILQETGDGCSALQCVELLSADCNKDDQRMSAQWVSKKDENYFILVQSMVRSEFDVSVKKLELDGGETCEEAVTLVKGGDTKMGSTFRAIMPSGLPECSEYNAPGVWFTVTGTGAMMVASTCHFGTELESTITVFRGSCDQLKCVRAENITCDGYQTMAYWDTIPSEQYFLFVHGVHDDDVGRFSLSFKEGALGVQNDYCGSATAISVPSLVYGSTIDATDDGEYQYTSLCGNFLSAPGMWYTVIGTGRAVTASLCGRATNYDTQLYVFAGDGCRQLECVSFNEDACGVRSQVTWASDEGRRYFILVSGFMSAVGDFELRVT